MTRAATPVARSTAPGGSSGQIQYNSGGAFAGAAALTYATSGTHLTATAQAGTVVPLAVQAATGQTADLQRWNLSDGVQRTRIDANGMLTIQPNASGLYALTVNDSLGNTRLQITTDAGTIITSDVFQNPAGYRVTAFGGYVGVLDYTRIVFNSTLDLESAGVSAGQFDNSTAAGQTRFLLWDVDKGALSRVSVGAADSGGTGFKLLRVPN